MFQLNCWNHPRYFKYETNSMILNHTDQFDILIENVYIKMQQKEIKITLLLSEILSKIILWNKDVNTQDLRTRLVRMANAH